jgi:hypothetical protein
MYSEVMTKYIIKPHFSQNKSNKPYQDRIKNISFNFNLNLI